LPFSRIGILALLALCLLSYGTMLSRLGLHFDDWSLVWVIHFLGPFEFTKAYLVDRPLLGWLMALTGSLFGENLLAWQIFGVVIRWFSCLSLWWLLRGLWPRRQLETAGVAFLFAVYPGFISIHIPVTRAHHILMLGLTLFSLGALNWALRTRAWFWPLYIVSILIGAVSLFTMEYYFGLELLRPLLIWLILSESIPQIWKRFKQAVFYYLPYGLTLLSFMIWRIVTPTKRGAVTLADKILTDPLSETGFAGIVAFLKLIFQDLLESSLLAWGQVFKSGDFLAGYDLRVIIIYLMIVVGAALLSALFLARLQSPTPESTHALSDRRWALQAIWVGALALLLGGIPVWVTDLHLELAFPWDRFTIAMMVGASLLLFGLLVGVSQFVTHRWRKGFWIILVSILVGLGAGFQFHIALTIRRDWQSQKDFFWQLAWRAPALQPGAALLTSELPFTYSNAYALTAPLNWMYAPTNAAYAMPYTFYDARLNFSEANLQAIENQQTVAINAENRMLFFHGSTSQAIYLIYQPPACLKIIDPVKDQALSAALPEKQRQFRRLLPLSKPALISAGPPAQPPVHIFGAQPDLNWCYYFEKADLARQLGDWRQVVELGEAVETMRATSLPGASNLAPKDYSEFVPIILGYGYNGDWQKAFELTDQAYRANKKLRLMLCDAWQALKEPASLDAQGQGIFDNLQRQLQCGS